MRGLNLQRLDSRSIPPGTDEIRAFLSVRDERSRLPFALDHHRHLGVHRFLVIDNGSSDGTIDYLLGQPDVHVFTTRSSYQEARNGIDWLEALLHFYGEGRWCLVLDADEHLVYPDCERVGLPAFCRALEERGLNSLATLFIDLYADDPIAETQIAQERSLPETCAFFDATGYYAFQVPGSSVPRLYGGPRARLFWPEIDVARLAAEVSAIAERALNQEAYLEAHADVAAEIQAGRCASALQHYLSYGHAERRTVSIRPVASWPEEIYLAIHPDVRAGIEAGSFSTGLEHYIRFGQFEGRRFWNAGPPCMSQFPLVRWHADMRLDVGRHAIQGGTWRRQDAVGGALLHFKLTADLASRARAVSEDTVHPTEPAWTAENQRYGEVLRRDPQLSGMWTCSVRYRDARQLVENGIVTLLPDL